MPHTFIDLVDVNSFQALMEKFFSITNIPHALLDTNGTILFKQGWTDICTRFHRVNPATLGRCRESDRRINSRPLTERYSMYQCGNGLIDIAVPLVVDQVHMATFYMGQFLLEEPDIEAFRRRAVEAGLDEEAYLAALRDVPIIPMERVKRVIDYSAALMGMLVEQGMQRLRLLRAEEALQEKNSYLETLIEELPLPVFSKDLGGRYQSCNTELCRLIGVERDWMLGKTARDLFQGEYASLIDSMDRRLVEGRGRQTFEQLTECNGAGPRHLVFNKAVFRNSRGEPAGIVGVISDITERKHREEKIRYLAQHDFLTRLPNRFLFMDRLHQEVRRCQRTGGFFAILYLDLDDFKGINDQHGHRVGDKVLQQVAAVLSSSVRDTDTVARIGGDEFVIILSGINAPENADVVAAKIGKLLEKPMAIHDLSLQVHASIGIGIYPTDSADADLLLKKADDAMYADKRGSRRD